MNKGLKQFFFIFCICITICTTNIITFAATEYVNGYLKYTVEDESITITGYNGREREVTIPSEIAGVPVNTIATGAFFNATTVTKVNLPDTIMTIEEDAFRSGQTVVYNSNTNDTVETNSEQNPKQDPNEEKNNNSSTEDMEDMENVGEIENSTNEETNDSSESDESLIETEIEGSIEEVDIDFSENLKEETSNNEKVEKENQETADFSFVSTIIFVMLSATIGIYIYRKRR